MKRPPNAEVVNHAALLQVLETSWTALQEELSQTQDLQGLIRAHDGYLSTIMNKALTSDDKRQISKSLQAVSRFGELTS
jgi:hypothetical protein